MSPALTRRLEALECQACFRVSGYWQWRVESAAPDEVVREFSPHAMPRTRIFALCGAQHAPEEILSLLSFLRHVGIPAQWTVISDGSLSQEDEARFRGLHPCVEVAPWENFITAQNRAAVERYVPLSPMGKKLAVVTALPTEGVSVYIDSDILFFPGAAGLRGLLESTHENFYMRDGGKGAVPEILTPEETQRPVLNAGFLIQGRPVAWREPLERLLRFFDARPEALDEHLTRHTLEQTVVHLGYQAGGAQMLDEETHVLKIDDAYRLRDLHERPDRVLRHYVAFVRQKMWREARHYLRPRSPFRAWPGPAWLKWELARRRAKKQAAVSPTMATAPAA